MKVMIKKPILNILRILRRSDWRQPYAEIKSLATKEEMISFQNERLEKLLSHAYRNVPYYNKIFDEYGIVNNDSVDLSRFNEIPILTKDIIKRHQKELLSRDYRTRRWYANSTGGSTGEPTTFIQDNVYDRWGNAAFYYYYKDILGIDEPSVKKVVLWGSERDIFRGKVGWRAKFENWLNNIVFLNSFKMTTGDMDRYLDIINSYQPLLVRGYASSLYELCRYAERKGVKIRAPQIVVSSAETLSDEMREQIEKGFGTKVYNFYGSRETNNLAGECREGLMHILAFHNYVEILNDNNQPVKEGEWGRVIVTNLHNYSMPFIRCDLGDIAVPGPSRCQCGNPLPTIKSILGRSNEVLLTSNKVPIAPTFVPYLFYPGCTMSPASIAQYQKIKQFQVIQRAKGDILIKIVKDLEVDEREFDYVVTNFKEHLGRDVKVELCFTDSIPLLPSGKRTYVISSLNKADEGTNLTKRT
jgi:phenylacetate-CoA ligase